MMHLICNRHKRIILSMLSICLPSLILSASTTEKSLNGNPRETISINNGWSFYKYGSENQADKLIYDVRPEIADKTENKVADTKPTEAVAIETKQAILKPWILPSGNSFINNPDKQHTRPDGDPGSDFPFVQSNFDDRSWEKVNLPHDWAIDGPFQTGWESEVGGGMGRLPVNGVGWYRKKLNIPASDAGKSIFLDIDGAMSYSIVWLNGHLVGGWPYGYNSYRLDLTPYVLPGKTNQLAIQIDNPNYSARWYPGGGLYRNVWLVKTNPVHVAQYGTFITTKEVSAKSATVNLKIAIDNDSKNEASVEVKTSVFALDEKGNKIEKIVASFPSLDSKIEAGKNTRIESSVNIKKPHLWGPPPSQKPNLYVAVTTLSINGKPIDCYETRFGIRSVEYNPDKGIRINGEPIFLKGVNQHHDLGALGAAFNTRAAERQLEILRDMGCNAIRMSHNPPAPELLYLCDKMGFLVIDEIFDSWELKKTPHDFHLIFADWSEPDTRAFIRRDRNCPSVILWSFGNEVGEQYTAESGAAVAKRIYNFVKEEDPTRPTTLAMNYAKPDMELPKVSDVIGLNYQGEGIRQSPEFEGTERIRTAPSYDAFHTQFPNKVVLSTETASAASSRGIYLFPVSKELSAPIRDGRGGDSKICQVSSYELHAVDFGSTADKVFGAIDSHPFVAGEFVWNGFDYIGEPTPYYEARSSYTGIIDLAGFPKDRYYLYQSHWLPEHPMVHILPHWNWPERMGKITPVHVFTSGDEAELFLNGKSLGKKKKGEYEYRLRWDDVTYEPGELKVIAYKAGKVWAEETVKTTGEASSLQASADRNEIKSDGNDLSFITVKITDSNGLVVPGANNLIEFSLEGPGEIVATDNGNSMDMTAFPSHTREAFNGMALVIVRSEAGKTGKMVLKAKSNGLEECQIVINGYE
ncbi:MAG TPA: beta-galactosidase GalB [Prolixibacteraceae bacterium]|nr:beta-galactosidase GalB [Prolixibacteraceae bacterium]